MLPAQIVSDWINAGKPHSVVGDGRVYLTDSTASTLVHAEGRVVIELYLLFPNIEAPLHSHPFENRMIYVSGDLVGYRGSTEPKAFGPSDAGKLSGVLPIGEQHGFTTGPAGAVMYNIQIWPEDVKDPVSAAVEYIGQSMGPRHEALLTADR